MSTQSPGPRTRTSVSSAKRNRAVPASVERPASIETTAWGAAYVAGLTRGLYPDPEAMAARWLPERCFTPRMPTAEREERYAGWRRAVAGVLAAVPPADAGACA